MRRILLDNLTNLLKFILLEKLNKIEKNSIFLIGLCPLMEVSRIKKKASAHYQKKLLTIDRTYYHMHGYRTEKRVPGFPATPIELIARLGY